MHKITKIFEFENGYDIECGNLCIFLTKEYYFVPKIGDELEYQELKGVVRGITINNQVIFYKSDEQLEKEHEEWCENHRKEKEQRFKANEGILNEKYEALPKTFKKIIDTFRKEVENFRIEHEEMEIFILMEAALVIMNCNSKREVRFVNESTEFPKYLHPSHSNCSFSKVFSYALKYFSSVKKELEKVM
jgi:hypothetical protein